MRVSGRAAMPFFGGLLVACSSHSSAMATNDGGADAVAPPVDAAAAIDAWPGSATEHGTILDYFSLKGIAGLTVSDNGMTSTTDQSGNWSITVPPGSVLSPTVTGSGYTLLYFPESVPAAADVDFGANVMPTSSNYQLELSGLSSDTSKALVQVVVFTAPTCASAAGGTLSVVSPPGAKIEYFATTGLPDETLTSFQDVTSPRPVAVVFDVAVGAEVRLDMKHPTCKSVGFPFTYKGRTYTGKVPTKASEPGDVNSAIALMLE